MLAISFLLEILWAVKCAEKRDIKQTDIVNLSFLIVLSTIVGSRALYVVTHLEELSGHWTDTFSPFQSSGEIGISGLTLLGGVVLSVITVVLFCAIKRIDILRLMDFVRFYEIMILIIFRNRFKEAG